MSVKCDVWVSFLRLPLCRVLLHPINLRHGLEAVGGREEVTIPRGGADAGGLCGSMLADP